MFPRCCSARRSSWTKELSNLWKFVGYIICGNHSCIWKHLRGDFKTFHWQWSQWEFWALSTFQHQTQECVIALWLPCKIMCKRVKVISEDNGHKQQDGKWDKFRSLPFLWSCLLSARFHVEMFSHSGPWYEMARIYALDISNECAFQLRDDDWTSCPSS